MTLPLVGSSLRLAGVRRAIEIARQRPCCDVAILAESGTGKELVAEAIAEGQPLVTVNIAAVSKELIGSALFGTAPGAFTGATNQKGHLEAAEGGVLFLDEFGDLPLDMQPPLLRLVERKEVQRLGESRTRKINARIVIATNADLRERVRNGRMREDLFYRIARMLTIRIPALRERPDDIPSLTDHFLRAHASTSGVPFELDPRTLPLLGEHAWPGNVRQLAAVIVSAATLAELENRTIISPSDIRDAIEQTTIEPAVNMNRPRARPGPLPTIPDERLGVLREFREKQMSVSAITREYNRRFGASATASAVKRALGRAG